MTNFDTNRAARVMARLEAFPDQKQAHKEASK